MTMAKHEISKTRETLKGFRRLKRQVFQGNQEAQEKADRIRAVLNMLPTKSANLLFLCYGVREKYTTYDLAERFNAGVSTIERWKSVALQEFSEAYRF